MNNLIFLLSKNCEAIALPNGAERTQSTKLPFRRRATERAFSIAEINTRATDNKKSLFGRDGTASGFLGVLKRAEFLVLLTLFVLPFKLSSAQQADSTTQLQ